MTIPLPYGFNRNCLCNMENETSRYTCTRIRSGIRFSVRSQFDCKRLKSEVRTSELFLECTRILTGMYRLIIIITSRSS
jgi:hypothetical protein